MQPSNCIGTIIRMMRLPFLDVGWHKLLKYKTLHVDRHLDRNAIETRIYDCVDSDHHNSAK